MSNDVKISFAGGGDVDVIRELAEKTWPLAYGKIISPEQLRYMLDMFYKPEALAAQMDQGHIFLLAEINNEPVGFASFSSTPEDNVYKLHKLYVLPSTQGKGVGKLLIDFVSHEARKAGAEILRLGVNKYNPAVQFYERMGFSKYKDEVTDIGHGFIMDDYILEKHLRDVSFHR